MSTNAMTMLWARTGLIWFLATMSFGMYLGMTKQFGLSSPHAHMGLLGWLSSFAFSWLHTIAGREAAALRGSVGHWAAHNAGLISMVMGLYTILTTGNESAGLLIVIGGSTIILATLWLTVVIWPRLGRGS